MAIYIHDEAARLRLRVVGDLDAGSAKQLASCWSTASSVVGFRKVVVDLTGLSTLDDPGRDLLEALHREGVEFLARSEFQNQLVAEITGTEIPKFDPAQHGVRGWLKGFHGATHA